MQLLAHLGSDHLALFLVPVVLAVGAMRLVEKRARERAESEDADRSGDAPAP